MRQRQKFENSLYSIRFSGEELEHRGVSIYDLSNSLLAFQRIVHKAHLAIEGRLWKGAFPDSSERKALALQIGERRTGSDVFALIPIFSDPQMVQYMQKLADYVFSGIVGYYVGDVLNRVKEEPDPQKQIFIGSIYTEVANIVNRVGTSGGVEAISIGAPALGHETVAAFDERSKSYLASIQDAVVLGKYQEIKGKVFKFYPASKIVAIRRGGGGSVSIFLNEADFDRIRYRRETNPLFLFRGHAKLQFGVETKLISEFIADSIEYIPQED